MPPLPGEQANVAVYEQLSRRVEAVDFKTVGFEDALILLRDKWKLNLFPSWAAMEAVGITRTTEISLKLRDVTGETALRELLTKAAGQEGKLDFTVRGGVVKVSTVEDLSSLRYILVYDIRDLLAGSKGYDAYRASVERRLSAEWPGPVVEGGPSSKDQKSPEWDWSIPGHDQRVKNFVDMLRTTVLPDTWSPTGDGVVIEHDGQLIVKQTASVHRDLADLLARLRLAAASAQPGPPDLPRPVLNPHERAALERVIREQTGQHRALGWVIKSLYFAPTSFEAALANLADRGRVNINVNWAAMEAVGITRQTEVGGVYPFPVKPTEGADAVQIDTYERAVKRIQGLEPVLKDVSVGDVLRRLLTQAAGREGYLDFMFRDGVVKVSTIEDLSALRYFRVYNVRDLRAAAEAYAAHRRHRYAGLLPKLKAASLPAAIEDEPVFGQNSVANWGTGQTWDRSFIDLLRTLVLPDSWEPTGDACLRFHDDLLIVKQSAHGHHDICRLMAQLRAGLAAATPASPAWPPVVLNSEERMVAGATHPSDSQPEEALARVIPEVRLEAVYLEYALLFLDALVYKHPADPGMVIIEPNWSAMEAMGVTRATEITLKLRDVTLATGLREVLTKASGMDGKLDYAVRDGKIKVSTIEDLSVLKYIQIYDIRDIVSAADAYHDRHWRQAFRNRPPMTLTAQPAPSGNPPGSTGSAGAAGSVGGTGAIFSGGGAGTSPDFASGYAIESPVSWPGGSAALMDGTLDTTFLNLLRSLVLPDTWAPSGDAIVLTFSHLLLVKQTANGHRELQRLLAHIRAAIAAGDRADVSRASAVVSRAVPGPGLRPGPGYVPVPIPSPVWGYAPHPAMPPLPAIVLVTSRPEESARPVVPGRPNVTQIARPTGGRVGVSLARSALTAATQPIESDPKWTASLAGLTAGGQPGQPGSPAGRVVYLVDSSGSMNTIFDYVKAFLKRSIGGLAESQQYQVLMFSDGPARAQGVADGLAFVPATEGNKRVTYKWLDEQVATTETGETLPQQALEAAFAISGGPPDVIFILSDMTWDGPDCVPLIAKLNADKKVRIYTVCLTDEGLSGPSPDQAKVEVLVKKIAQQNGGGVRVLRSKEMEKELGKQN